MIPLCIPNLGGNEARYLVECVDTNFVSSVGPFVDRFEEELREVTGARFAVATASGTAGLHVALLAAGVGRDDLVLLPSFTFIASANAIAHCGADPWLLDVSEASWTLDPEAVERTLATETESSNGGLRHRATGRRVAAIMPVYTLGLPADMDRLVALANDYALPVVADAAAAIGARYKDRSPGCLGAQLEVLSFNGNKTVTCGGGGAVLASDEQLARLVRHLTTTARVSDAYDHDRVGFNYRMTNLHAALGCAQLEQLESFVAAKRRIAETYNHALADLPGVRVFPAPPWANGARWFSGLALVDRRAAEVVPRLQERGVDARPFWKPLTLQAPYRDCPRAPTPVTDRIWPTVLTLPCSTALTRTDQDAVINAVRAVLID
jgi:aminotransferase in exopolysaccharide biosynthesis